MNARRMFRLYGIEVRSEFLRLLRTPIYAFSTLGLPLMFYAFFGLALNREAAGGLPPMARYLLASYGAFGVMAASLFGFGVRLAIDRGLGWLEVKRASPMPPPAYFTAKTVVCLCFSAILVALMFTMGVVFGGVRIAASQLLLLGASLVLGALPFCALGLAIGYFATADSSPAVVNMLYLPMSFCSGLWIPLPFLPHALQQAAPALPPYHLAQIALAVLKAPSQGAIGTHIEALIGFTLMFTALAWVGHQREQAKMY